MLLVRGGVKREKPDRQGNNFCKVIIPLPVRVKREKPDRQGNNSLCVNASYGLTPLRE